MLAEGYILSRALEAHGRPVAFAFTGAPAQPDGSSLTLKPKLLKQSLNFKALATGQAYPLYYDTLFVDLRTAFSKAAVVARKQGAGVWKSDLSTAGLKITDQAALEQNGVVFPKLFRRLTEYLNDHPDDPAGFLAWLADKREQVLDLTTNNFTHLRQPSQPQRHQGQTHATARGSGVRQRQDLIATNRPMARHLANGRGPQPTGNARSQHPRSS